MTYTFKIGDHVTWNSEAGRVSGYIMRVHTSDVDYKGYTHHASTEEPQYEIRATRRIILPCTRARHCSDFLINGYSGSLAQDTFH